MCLCVFQGRAVPPESVSVARAGGESKRTGARGQLPVRGDAQTHRLPGHAADTSRQPQRQPQGESTHIYTLLSKPADKIKQYRHPKRHQAKFSYPFIYLLIYLCMYLLAYLFILLIHSFIY